MTLALAEVKKAIDKMPAEDRAKSEESTKLTYQQHFAFQEIKSLASSSGYIALEDAMVLYRWLGQTETVFNKQPLEVRSLTLMLLGALMKKMKPVVDVAVRVENGLIGKRKE
jgi:hypothetical protein